MPTFTDENSALGDLNNRVKIPCSLPACLGIHFPWCLLNRERHEWLRIVATLCSIVRNYFDNTVLLVRKRRTNAHRG